MSISDRLDEIQARHGEWYGDGEFYIGPPATWPERDPGESKERYIVRCDVPDMLAALRAVLDLCDKALAVKVSGSSEGDAAMAAFAAAAHTAIAATLGEES